MRLEILEFILNIFTYFLTNVSFLEPGVKQNNLEGSIQYFSSKNALIRITNTIISQIKEIQFRSDDLGLDRLGTHIIECKFGVVRVLCKFKHDWHNIIKSFSKLLVLDDLTNSIGIPINIKGRVNDGGIHMKGDTRVYQTLAGNIFPNQLIEDFNQMIEYSIDETNCDICLVEKAKRRINYFVVWIQEYIQKYKDAGFKTKTTKTESMISNQTILTRLICFSKEYHKNYDTNYVTVKKETVEEID